MRGTRQRAGRQVGEVGVERRRAAALVARLDRSLGFIDWDRVADRDVAGRALTARDALGPLLGSDDPADLVGAGVLARLGARDLERGRSGRGDALVTCFFDPRHHDASTTVRWRLGGRGVEVPACDSCAEVVRAGGTPPHLRVEVDGAVVAYCGSATTSGPAPGSVRRATTSSATSSRSGATEPCRQCAVRMVG
jgi:hypothetical protein